MFCAARCCPHEGLLDGRAEVLILKHISRPSTFKMEVKIFPIHDVNAIALKLDGDGGSYLADPLSISLMDVVFHACGIVNVCQC